MVNVFISYCHKNSKLVEPFLDYIQPLCSGDKPAFKIWIDNNNIKPGDKLSDEIEKGILNADIAILCLTRKYLISPSCQNENKRFLELQQSINHKRVSILPLIFEQCEWTADSIGLKNVKTLNYDAKPFSTVRDRDAWLKDAVGRLKLCVSAISQNDLLVDFNIDNTDLVQKPVAKKLDLIESNNESEISIKIPTENLKNSLVDFLKRFFPEVSIVKSGNYTGDRELSRKYLIHGKVSYLYNVLCVMSWIWENDLTNGLEYENLSTGDMRRDKSLHDVLEILQEDYV